jgi:hypothetical protein
MIPSGPTVFTKNRDRLLSGDIARAFFERVLAKAKAQPPALGGLLGADPSRTGLHNAAMILGLGASRIRCRRSNPLS